MLKQAVSGETALLSTGLQPYPTATRTEIAGGNPTDFAMSYHFEAGLPEFSTVLAQAPQPADPTDEQKKLIQEAGPRLNRFIQTSIGLQSITDNKATTLKQIEEASIPHSLNSQVLSQLLLRIENQALPNHTVGLIMAGDARRLAEKAASLQKEKSPITLFNAGMMLSSSIDITGAANNQAGARGTFKVLKTNQAYLIQEMEQAEKELANKNDAVSQQLKQALPALRKSINDGIEALSKKLHGA